MLISDATARAFDEITARTRDVLQAFTPGAISERSDVSTTAEEQFTFNPLSASAPPNAYFAVAGDREVTFTRAGTFEIRGRVLTDASGHAVLGYRGAGEPLAPLQVDAVDASLGLVANPHIEPDGAVAYDRQSIDPRTGLRAAQKVVMGRVALARFPAGSKLQASDGVHVSAPPGVAAHFGVPDSRDFRALTPFTEERSSIDLDAGLERLDDAYLALDALRAATKAQGGVQKTAMDLLK